MIAQLASHKRLLPCPSPSPPPHGMYLSVKMAQNITSGEALAMASILPNFCTRALALTAPSLGISWTVACTDASTDCPRRITRNGLDWGLYCSFTWQDKTKLKCEWKTADKQLKCKFISVIIHCNCLSSWTPNVWMWRNTALSSVYTPVITTVPGTCSLASCSRVARVVAPQSKKFKWETTPHTSPHTYTHPYTPTCPGIQSEDTVYPRVYSVFVPAFKVRTNLCITHSKWGHFFTHLWTCLARTKRGLRPYPPTPILWKSEDSAHSHKARTEILTSLCQNVLTLNVKNWFWSSLWMPGRTHTHKGIVLM